jgi:hypothetical protein
VKNQKGEGRLQEEEGPGPSERTKPSTPRGLEDNRSRLMILRVVSAVRDRRARDVPRAGDLLPPGSTAGSPEGFDTADLKDAKSPHSKA